MKKLLLFLTLLFVIQASAQQKFKAAVSVGGASLNRGGEFEYVIYGNGINNDTTRQLLFDLQYDRDNFEIVSVSHTGTGGNGGILPQGSTINLSYYDYPGYNFLTVSSGSSANNTTNGTTNYQYAQYNYSNTNPYSILRVTLTWSTNSAMPYSGYSDFIKIKYRLKAASTAYTFNPIKLNFVAGWNASGAYDATIMEAPLTTAVAMNQNYGKYVTAKVDLNSNLFNLSNLKVSFRDTLTNTGVLFPVTSTGDVDVNQSQLAANKVYEVSLMHDMDKLYDIYGNAITISDFTTAQNEFTSMGLDGSNGQNLKTGQSLYAADINRNRTIDGGDLPRLLGQVANIDTLKKVPSTYVTGTGGYMSIPTWNAAEMRTLAGQVEWVYVSVGTSNSTLYVDMRKFPNGTSASSIKSIQLFDVYTGPIEYISEDAQSWAQYKIPSIIPKATDGTSLYSVYIRNNGSDYMFQAEPSFNTSVNGSWGAINTTNWKDITYPRTYLTTGSLGTNAILDLKYLLWGDVNRSHSSQVVTVSGGSSTVQTNAVNSLQTNTAFRNMSTFSTGGFINTPYDISSVDVNLANLTVTSNTIEIPVSLDTKGLNVSGLQFEFTYDPKKIKFEELVPTVPSTWYIFANDNNGRIKFGALDQNKSAALTGISIPFKLKFSTIGNGVDIITSVKVSPLMDASDAKGNQLGISLNSTQIKLTGYNNF
jgi:archaellum component FlaG (FlaF/FlaG flagellin family)